MRSPVVHLAHNLRWTRYGTVWADWRIAGLPYGFRPDTDKQEIRALHQALLRALPGESLLASVATQVDPVDVVERMIAGIDLEQCPDWATECEATFDTLDQLAPGGRVFWLSVPLGHTSSWSWVTEATAAAGTSVRDALALPRAPISEKEVDRRLTQAARIASVLPAPFQPTPATPAQMLWLHLHAQQRGLHLDGPLPESAGDSAGWVTSRGPAALPNAVLDEGAQADRSRRTPVNPLAHRYLKVTQPGLPGDASTGSYQALLALADVPSEGMVFPGSEFIGRLDETGLDVDWAMRLHVRSSAEVSSKNRRALVNLNEQFNQRDGEVSLGLGVLDRAAADLSDYAHALDSDKLEVETQVTLILAVAGPTATDATEQARGLADYLGQAGFRLTQPLGGQEELWWAMQPGVPTSRLVRDLAQITTSRALAASVPMASTELGDRVGALMALNITSGRPSVVLHDIAGAAGRDISGSVGVAGELGSGKSTLLKLLAGAAVDRGGRIVVPDRTAMGEYAAWATSITDAQVVSVDDPTTSLDPLRLFPGPVGAQVALSFLTPLLNVAPTSAQGVLLSEVLDPDYLTQHHITGMSALPAHLAGADLPGATELGRLINVFARKAIGRVVFDPSLPALAADSSAIIVRTHGLQLPTVAEMDNQHLFAQMPVEKILGRAMYALIAALARRWCFADRSRLGVFVVDEAHHVTSSPEGERELIDFIRDGRKHQAAVLLGSHDPEADFGSPTLRGLIPTRVLMRHRDHTLARRGLAWLDLDPTDETLVKLLTEDTSPVGADGVPWHRRGEGLLRHPTGVGRIKVLEPSRPERAAAARTSPPEQTRL